MVCIKDPTLRPGYVYTTISCAVYVFFTVPKQNDDFLSSKEYAYSIVLKVVDAISEGERYQVWLRDTGDLFGVKVIVLTKHQPH